MTLTIIVIAVWTAASVAVCLGAHRARLAATPTPPPPDPEDPADDTADDYDDDTVRVDGLPPVPLPAYWSESDDAMVAWFCAGRADR